MKKFTGQVERQKKMAEVNHQLVWWGRKIKELVGREMNKKKGHIILDLLFLGKPLKSVDIILEQEGKTCKKKVVKRVPHIIWVWNSITLEKQSYLV